MHFLHAMSGIVLLVGSLLAVSPGQAVTPAAAADDPSELVKALSVIPDDPITFTAIVENDVIFAVDRHYSSGVSVMYTTSRGGTPSFMRRIGHWFAPEGEVHATLALAHNIYTSRSIIMRRLDDRDRPYAAMLYASAGIEASSATHYDNLTLTLGTIGPAALGKQFQEVIHAAIGPTPRRWDSQLSNEPAMILAYTHAWRRQLGTIGGLRAEWLPQVDLVAGNIFTYGGAGMTFRVGDHMPLDYGPTRVLPAIQGSTVFVQASKIGWYVFAGSEVRGVVRNIFLDGNTWAESRNVPKHHTVVDIQFGWAIVWRNTRLSMSHVLRTKEFERQADLDLFGSLDLSIHR
ncbi:MAG: lipid A deacylase LpxR family protein [Clostridia bacterium]|nr:lipid A deacylase LpxR family protein [Deltaproteobacteria bacterium]